MANEVKMTFGSATTAISTTAAVANDEVVGGQDQDIRAEPEHGWCFYYQKAAFTRQLEDWDGVLQLGEEAFGMGLYPSLPLQGPHPDGHK